MLAEKKQEIGGTDTEFDKQCEAPDERNADRIPLMIMMGVW